MRQTNCKECGKKTKYPSALYCPNCGTTICPACAKKDNDLCPHCFTPLNRFS